MPQDAGFFQIVKELAAAGSATMLVAILVAGKMGYWVFGQHYESMRKEMQDRYDAMAKEKDAIITYERSEKDEWRALVWDARKLTEKSVTLAAKAVNP